LAGPSDAPASQIAMLVAVSLSAPVGTHPSQTRERSGSLVRFDPFRAQCRRKHCRDKRGARTMRSRAGRGANRLTPKPFGTIGSGSLVRCTIRTHFVPNSARSGAGDAVASSAAVGRTVGSPIAKYRRAVFANWHPSRPLMRGMRRRPVRITIPVMDAAMTARSKPRRQEAPFIGCKAYSCCASRPALHGRGPFTCHIICVSRVVRFDS
jgi:hypothetical protein